jgi:hypothetical protein
MSIIFMLLVAYLDPEEIWVEALVLLDHKVFLAVLEVLQALPEVDLLARQVELAPLVLLELVQLVQLDQEEELGLLGVEELLAQPVLQDQPVTIQLYRDQRVQLDLVAVAVADPLKVEYIDFQIHHSH